MKTKKSLISVLILILLLLNLSIGVFAEGDEGPTRPKLNNYTEYEESNTP